MQTQELLDRYEYTTKLQRSEIARLKDELERKDEGHPSMQARSQVCQSVQRHLERGPLMRFRHHGRVPYPKPAEQSAD